MIGRRVNVEDNSLTATPAPVPFKLNLKPGEFLTRSPPNIPQQQPIWIAPSGMAHVQHPHPRNTNTLSGNRIPYYLSHKDESNDWSPERLYQETGNEGPMGVYVPQANGAFEMRRRPLLPVHSRQNVRFVDDQIFPDGHVSPLQQSRRGSPSMPQPSQVVSSNASIYSESSSRSRSLGPPSSAERFRPKRIVMPTPLQSQPQPQKAMSRPVLPSANSSTSNQSAMQPTAAHIPMHDQKKGNLLKKRTSMKPPLQRQPSQDHIAPHVGLGEKLNQPLAALEQKLPKATRKLSKRKI